MKIIQIEDIAADPNPNFILKTVFDSQIGDKTHLKIGTVLIPAGKWVPIEGSGVHEGDEYSIVISGEIKTFSGGKEYRVKKGGAAFIPAGEHHWALNDGDTDCEIVWALVEP